MMMLENIIKMMVYGGAGGGEAGIQTPEPCLQSLHPKHHAAMPSRQRADLPTGHSWLIEET